jgi:hypothetical protein
MHIVKVPHEATIHVTNFVATCNDCSWLSCGNYPTFLSAIDHASSLGHTVHIATTTHGTIYGKPKTT